VITGLRDRRLRSNSRRGAASGSQSRVRPTKGDANDPHALIVQCRRGHDARTLELRVLFQDRILVDGNIGGIVLADRQFDPPG
jgi:hypothetical protein